jgi:GT2 family glycosyltransferase
MLAPRYRTQDIDPPTPHAQTCNIVYPRELLERLGGFLEDVELIGEDTELAARARAAGVAQIGAAEALTYHAVEAQSLPRRARAAWRWRGLPRLVKLRPELREQAFVLRFFWKRSHLRFVVAAAGLALARRRRAFLALALPWAWSARLRRARSPLGLAVALAELPGSALVDASEVAALAAGSLRDRTLLL